MDVEIYRKHINDIAIWKEEISATIEEMKTEIEAKKNKIELNDVKLEIIEGASKSFSIDQKQQDEFLNEYGKPFQEENLKLRKSKIEEENRLYDEKTSLEVIEKALTKFLNAYKVK